MHEDALAVFASELRALKGYAGNPPLKEITHQAERQVPPVSLKSSTLSDWFNGRSAPDAQPPIAFLLRYLHGRAVARDHDELFGVDWYEELRARAFAQKSAARGGRPGSRPRPRPARNSLRDLPTVREADPLLLGVHRPIRVHGHDESTLPPYVRRDVDHGAGGLRTRLRTAVRNGGFLLLVGGSSVGKTRTLYEALAETVPAWHLLQPSSPSEVAAAVVGDSSRRLVVWLDELHRYLEGQEAVGAPTVRALLKAGVLVVATIGPRAYAGFTAPPAGDGSEDRHRGKREVLRLAEVFHVGSEFSPREWHRAEMTARKSAAAGDRRLRVAVEYARSGREGPSASSAEDAEPAAADSGRGTAPGGRPQASDGSGLMLHLGPDHALMSEVQQRAILWFSEQVEAAQPRIPSDSSRFGLTQTLAAAPQLIERWRNADGQELPYARSVLTAGIDLARLGVTSPLGAELLKAVAWGYCTPEQRARATADWFDEALTYATRVLLGATSALVPVMVERDGSETVGYRPADYLLERASVDRAGLSPPEAFWRACATHLTDGRELLALGSSAVDRLRYVHAVPLLTKAFEDGEAGALLSLTTILQGQRRVGALVALVRAHQERCTRLPVMSAMQLAHALAEAGCADEAVALLLPHAENDLASLLTATVCDGSGHVGRLAELAEAGNGFASSLLSRRFLHSGSELLKLLQQPPTQGEPAEADTHGSTGPTSEAPRAEIVEADALLVLLSQGRMTGPGALLAPAHHSDHATFVDRLLAVTELFVSEAARLSGLAVTQQPSLGTPPPPLGVPRPPEEVAREAAEAGDVGAALDALDQVRGERNAEWMRATLLCEHGRPDEAFDGLRALAAAGDFSSAIRLSELLVACGRAEEALDLLRERERAGDPFVFVWLDHLLAEHGHADELADRATRGDTIALERLTHVAADALVTRGRFAEAFALLREGVDAGRKLAASELVGWLTRHGREDEADRLRRWGLDADGSVAAAPETVGTS
ncbi:hypothetical protein ACIPPS_12030 [Streptomyces sp. NPDC090127]|uniref:hypothetical protein n=1 Tax=Streptomyces sp. NPDC090127 TaxID=3365953 RepID=UPI0037FE174E